MAAFALAGCGSGGTAAPAPAPTPLTSKGATRSLLTSDDVPSGFAASTSSGSGASQVGCLSATDDLTSVTTDVHARSAFVKALPAGASGVLSQVFSDPDPSVLSNAFDTFEQAMASCTSVTDSATDGVAVDLSISTNTTVTDPAASQQLNLEADGTLTSKGRRYQYQVGFVVSLVDGSMSIVATYDLATDLDAVTSQVVDQLPQLSATVVDRLAQQG